MRIKKGTNRIVFLFFCFAIKIPNFLNGHLLFLHGCLANYKERNFCKIMKNVENNRFYNLVAPTMYCSWFGLFSIQVRCKPIKDMPEKNLLNEFNRISGDVKISNMGVYKDNVVLFDYAD